MNINGFFFIEVAYAAILQFTCDFDHNPLLIPFHICLLKLQTRFFFFAFFLDH